jgi:methyl-galactoside transport system permease protein
MDQKKISADAEAENVSPFKEGGALDGYVQELRKLRADGENKILALKNEIRELKRNKQIDDETRKKLIVNDKKSIKQARIAARKNAGGIKKIKAKALLEAKAAGQKYYDQAKALADKRILEARAAYEERSENIKNEHLRRLAEIKNLPTPTREAKKDKKSRLAAEKVLYDAQLGEAKSILREAIQSGKDAKYEAYLEKYAYQNKIRNNKHSILENLEFNLRHYSYTFELKNWFLKNALYLVIVVFYIYCVIDSKGVLIQFDSLRNILSQSATKIFFSLGVAGLILIAGTDLSVGRMTGMATSFACMFLGVQGYTSALTHMTIDTTSWPYGYRVIAGLLFCILVCTLFSAMAGFFSARFKMHPFITTLSTQLLIFGWMEIEYSNYPAFNIDSETKMPIVGAYDNYLIIYAAIAVVIMWFIWNKTKFGKNMYAVGGNPEAAAVSGINVFSTTIMIFVMAGVCYGIGGFLEGARVGVATPATGSGTELDAIAACVVGGISFSGGIGKISGAVIGTIIFQGMTYCLTNLGISPYYQFIFKGVIIMAAVCLDSLKYLKKK